jgi:hypothetical protein
MPAISSRRAAGLVVAVVLVALAATGCTGGIRAGGTDTGGRTGGAAGGELKEKPAGELRQEASAALRAAKSVHVTGASIDKGKPVTMDLRIQGSSSTGTMALAGARFAVTVVGATTYLKGGQQAWKALGAPPPVQGFAARWVKLRSEQLPELEGRPSLDFLASQLVVGDSPLAPSVERTELNGRQAVVLSQQDGSKLYVTDGVPAYPLRAETKGRSEGRLDFTEYGADFHITAPGNALSNAMTRRELAWLKAIPKVSAKIEKAVTDSSTLTPSVMRSLAGALGACTRELLGDGSPSDRLLPVHALVKKGCAAYDKGAKCFATAAGIGIPLDGTPQSREVDRAIKCGLDAQGHAYRPLFEAQDKGSAISAEVV